MFWTWTVLAVPTLVIALLTGRLGALVVGGFAATAATLDWLGSAPVWQWTVCIGGWLAVAVLGWRNRRG